MCIYCCEHNEGASCFYKRVKIKHTESTLEQIEYIPGYGFIMPGVMTTNGIAISIYNHLSDADQVEFIEYVGQSIDKHRFEIFTRLIGN